MPVTDWVKATSVTGTNWSPVGAASLILALASPNDSQYATHAQPATDKLKCLNYDFAAEGIISTDVIDGVEFQCYGTTGLPEIVAGNTIGCYLTLDGSTPIGDEKTFNCDGPGMQSAILGGPSDPWGNSLTGTDILVTTFGVLIAEGSDTAGDLNGRRVDYERMRISYSAGTVTPVTIMASKHKRIPDLGMVKNKGLGEKTI